MKKNKNDSAKKSTDVAEHVIPPVPELVLQVCPKCDANYNRNALDKCPGCGEPRPEGTAPQPEQTPQAVEQDPAPVEIKPEFPYINQPAVTGGVIIKVESGTVFRDMTQDDVNAAAEEIGTISMQHGEVAKFLAVSEANVLDLEQRLKDARGIVRTTEVRLLDVGAQLAELGRAVRSGKREWQTQITLTVTPGNEVIYTDAKTGIQIGDKRTATAEELKAATNRQAALLNPDAPHEVAQDIDTAKGKGKKGPRKTTDSPSHKPDPGEELLKASISSSAFNRLTPRRKDDMRSVPGMDDEPGYPLNWQLSEDGERMAVFIPRRLLATLRTMAGPNLDFKQETGGVQVEVTE